jgi:hypothetical protein
VCANCTGAPQKPVFLTQQVVDFNHSLAMGLDSVFAYRTNIKADYWISMFVLHDYGFEV